MGEDTHFQKFLWSWTYYFLIRDLEPSLITLSPPPLRNLWSMDRYRPGFPGLKPTYYKPEWPFHKIKILFGSSESVPTVLDALVP